MKSLACYTSAGGQLPVMCLHASDISCRDWMPVHVWHITRALCTYGCRIKTNLWSPVVFM